MAQKTILVQLRDFTGGLNERADQVQLAPNETPDCLNVDLDPRGGFRTRRGINYINSTALPATPLVIGSFSTTTGTEQVLAQSNNFVYFSTGSNFTITTLALTASARAHMVTFNDKAYVQDGTAVAKSWDGTTAVSLGEAWSPDVDAPTTGNMPRARYIAVHHNRVWLAGITESGVLKPNRVRWSHLGRADAWRSEDFMDIDIGSDGDIITAVLPFKDELMVWKRRTTHAIFGFDEDDFRTLPSTQAAGAPSQESVCASPTKVYWWSWPDGVFSHDGSKTFNLFDKVRPAIINHTIDAADGGPVLSWAESRLYVSVPWDVPSDPTDGRHTLVYDPSLPEGCWTRYDLAMTSAHFWRKNSGTSQYLMTLTGQMRVFTLADEVAQQGDNYGAGVVAIRSRYVTRWEDAGLLQARKQFRRPRVVAYAEADADVRVKVYRDFDNRQPRKTMVLQLRVIGDGGTWGDAIEDQDTILETEALDDLETEALEDIVSLVGDTSTSIVGVNGNEWDDMTWGSDTTVNTNFLRLSSLGLCYAVQLVFETDVAVARWGIDAIAIPTVLKKVR